MTLDETMTADPRDTERARVRAAATVGMLWHVASFVIINAVLWALDLMTGGGLTWAMWITIPWAFGLAFHVVSWWIDDGQLEDRLTDYYLRDTGHGSHA